MRTKVDGRGRLGQHTPLDTGRGGLIPGVALKELFCNRHSPNSAVSGQAYVGVIIDRESDTPDTYACGLRLANSNLPRTVSHFSLATRVILFGTAYSSVPVPLGPESYLPGRPMLLLPNVPSGGQIPQ